MKLKKTELDESQIGNFDAINSTIAAENMGLAMTMVSKNLYSNPIGSFIRELTSNAVDANVDANVNSPILIHMYIEDDIYFIEFKDNGVGMSPTTFKDIYMSWFNSDKRNTNDKIGGWGLGSKSPFAYQDSFEIITVFDNIKYHYIFANEQPVPTATLLLEEQTDEPNGTTIRVEVNDEDTYKIHNECKKQLVYFDNVYVKNELYFYDNNFKIYESDTYKLRNKDFPYGNEMHISLGQVAYPINWNVLDIEPVYIPVAIKFDIGELEVTLSREELNYTDDVKTKILEKVRIVETSIIEKYKEQLKVDDLFDYIKLVKSDNKPPLKIHDVEIPMNTIKASIYFTPFDGIKIKADDVKNLFYAYNVTQIKKGKNFALRSDSYQQYYRLYRYPYSTYLVAKDFNYFDSLYINDGFAFKRGKMTPYRFKRIALALNLILNKKDLLNTYGSHKPIYKQGTALIVYKVLKYVDNYLLDKIQPYNGAAPQYWIEEKKEEARQKKEDTKGSITYYNIKNKRTQIKLLDLLENNEVIFYISKNNNKEKIVAYNDLYDLGNPNFKKKTSFVIISPTTINKIKKFRNVHSIENIFKVKSYKNLLYKMRISKFVDKYLKPYRDTLRKYSTHYFNEYSNIVRYYNISYTVRHYDIPIDSKHKEDMTIDLVEYFKPQLKKIKRTKNRSSLLYENNIFQLIRIGQRMELLQYISNNTPHPLLVEYIKTLKLLKLKNQYYDKNFYYHKLDEY